MTTRKLEDLPTGIVATATPGISGGVKDIDFNNEKTGINAIDPVNPTDLTNKQWVESQMPMSNVINTTVQVGGGLEPIYVNLAALPFDFELQYHTSLGNFRIINQDSVLLHVSFELDIHYPEGIVLTMVPDGTGSSLPISIGSGEYLTNDGLASDQKAISERGVKADLILTIFQLGGSNVPATRIRLKAFRYLSKTPVADNNDAVTVSGDPEEITI